MKFSQNNEKLKKTNIRFQRRKKSVKNPGVKMANREEFQQNKNKIRKINNRKSFCRITLTYRLQKNT